VFVTGKIFQPSLMFAGKAGAYPSEGQLQGRLLTLPKNVRLDWKGLPVTHTLVH
jgi:hypothetical protein